MTQPTLDGIPSLPFTSKRFQEAWADWIEHRKEIRKPMKETGIKYQLRALAKMDAQDIPGFRS